MNTVYVVNSENVFKPQPGALGVELNVQGAVVQVAAASVAAWISKKVEQIELSVKTNDVLYTLDNTAPVTAGAGIHLPKGIYHWHIDKVRAAKFIRAAGEDNGVIRFEPGV